MRLLDFFLPSRSNSSSDSQFYEHLPLVVATTFILGLLYLALIADLGIYFGVGPLFLEAFAAFLAIIAALILMKKGRYRIAANLATASLVWAVAIIALLTEYKGNNIYETYRALAFAAVLAVINAALSLDKRQIWMFFIAVGLIWIAAFLSVFYHYYTETPASWFGALIPGAIGFVCENILLLFIQNLSTRLVSQAITERRKAEDALQSMTILLKDAKEGMAIGGDVVKATYAARDASQDIVKTRDYLAQEAKQLAEAASTLSDSSNKVQTEAKGIENDLGAQNDAIMGTSSALTQITQNLNSMSKIATDRKKMLTLATANQENEKKLLDRLEKAFASVRDSTKGIGDFTATVQDIASRTALLSMNASIEAARAGSSGKGFAVVAQEIRTLSGETQKNSELIQETVKRNQSTVDEASSLMKDFSHFVSVSIDNLKSLIEAIDEILNGIEEIHSGTAEVSDAMQKIVEGMRDSSEKAKEVVTEVDGQQQDIEHLRQFSRELDSHIGDLREAIGRISEASSRALEVGRLNIEQAKKLQYGDLLKLEEDIEELGT